MTVEVYWNPSKQLYSIRRKRKVIAHVPFLTLKNVEWLVLPTGSRNFEQNVPTEKHAVTRGTWLYGDDELQLVHDLLRLQPRVSLTYNPSSYDGFIIRPQLGAQRKGVVTHSAYAKLGSQWEDHLRKYSPVAYAYDYIIHDTAN
jgi:hypothetical protein